MILTCDECSTRYVVDPVSIGPTGRTVRCSRCGYSWGARPNRKMSAREAIFEDIKPIVRPLPPGSNLPVLQKEPGNRASVVLWILVLAVIFGSVGSAVWKRDFIMTRVPETTEIFSAFGLISEPPGYGLQIQEISQILQRTEGGKIVIKIKGFVVNISDKTRIVPDLVIKIYDKNHNVVMRKNFAPSALSIFPKERNSFIADLVDPPPQMKQLNITFDHTLKSNLGMNMP